MSKNHIKNKHLIVIMSIIFSILGCNDPEVQVDFSNLPLIETNNYYLVCPPNYCSIEPHEISPVYPIKLDLVVRHWKKVIAQEPRVTVVAEDNENNKFTYVQVSKLMRFPDTINIEFIPLEHNHTTIAVYSQSKYGYSDLGVNQLRVESWLKKLDKALEQNSELNN